MGGPEQKMQRPAARGAGAHKRHLLGPFKVITAGVFPSARIIGALLPLNFVISNYNGHALYFNHKKRLKKI